MTTAQQTVQFVAHNDHCWVAQVGDVKGILLLHEEQYLLTITGPAADPDDGRIHPERRIMSIEPVGSSTVLDTTAALAFSRGAVEAWLEP